MKKIRIVQEYSEVWDYLEKRGIVEPYKKAVSKILSDHVLAVSLKLRKPKKDKIWQLRINKKYRAFAVLKDDKMRVFEISDHQ